jgi:hypothetical protein
MQPLKDLSAFSLTLLRRRSSRFDAFEEGAGGGGTDG